jgi:hypothetical protein
MWHTLRAMSNVERSQRPSEPKQFEQDDRATRAIELAISTLLDGLSPIEKERVLRAVMEKLRPIPAPLAGDALGIVIQLIPRDREWTVAELKKRVEEETASVTAKEVHNAVGYLKRKKHINRLGYGRYVIDGMPFVTSDEVGGQPSITEQDLDD